MKYENTQKGNPHELTINQHIFPSKSIERFLNKQGYIEVYLKSAGKKIKLKPDDKLFCARRSWDQRSEVGFMRDIEDSYQHLASKIISQEISTLNDKENGIATAFFALWEQRYSRNINPINDSELIGVLPGKPLSKDEEEILEKNGYVFARNGNFKAIAPSRFMNGLNIQASIDRERYKYKNVKWGIVSCVEGEFIVPDTFSSNAIIPVSPKIILLGGSENLVVAKTEVKKVNNLAISVSKNYFFGRELLN